MNVITINKICSVFILVSFCAAPQISVAKMYKWVDENGNTHYSQSPPPGDIEATEISPPPKVDTDSAQKELESQIKQADQLKSDRYKKAENEEKERKIAMQKEQQCNSAKASLASYQRPRVNRVNEDGSRSIMPEEERIKGLERAKQQVKEACN